MAIEAINKDLNKQKTILIIGGAGGVGSIAIQLAKWADLTVVTTASRQSTVDWVKELGADFVINHHHSFQEQLKQQGIANVDFILCLNNTEQHWEAMAEAIKPQGKIALLLKMQSLLI